MRSGLSDEPDKLSPQSVGDYSLAFIPFYALVAGLVWASGVQLGRWEPLVAAAVALVGALLIVLAIAGLAAARRKLRGR